MNKQNIKSALEEAIKQANKDIISRALSEQTGIIRKPVHVKEEMYRTIDRKLAEFTKLKESPYFGKVNFEDNGYAEQIYVGRYGLTPEGSFDPAIVDWRAPVASLFYKGT